MRNDVDLTVPGLLDAVLAALQAPLPADEEERWRKAPYPTPTIFREAETLARPIVETLRDAPEDGPLYTQQLVGVTWLKEAARLLLTESSFGGVRFELSNTVCVLLACGALPVSELGRLLEADRFERLVLARIAAAAVSTHLARADLAAAHDLADDPCWTRSERGKDVRPTAWRTIGEWHLRRAEADEFLALWDRYRTKPVRNFDNKLWLDQVRRGLITRVSEERGWRAAADLADDARLGDGAYRGAALIPLVEAGDVDELRRAHGDPVFAGLTEPARISQEVRALRVHAPRRPDHDHPELAALLERILAIDPLETKEAMRTRDNLLVDCWPLIGDEATLKRVRAALRTPALRRELKVLAREIPDHPPVSD